jgi:uroporphyrinogen-III decarboxylase
MSGLKGALYGKGLHLGKLNGVGRAAAAAVGKPDHPPSFAQMHDHAMHVAKAPAKRFYYEAPYFVDVMMAVANYYGLDLPLCLADVYNYEAEAMGAKMIYGEDSMPTIDFTEPLIKKPEDLLRLKPPNPLTDGRMPYAVEVVKIDGERLGFSLGSFCAPFSLACGIRSYPLLIRDMKKNPSFAHDLFTFLVDEVLVPFVKVQKEQAGVRFALGADAWAAFPNLTPELAEEWVAPYARRLREACKPFGVLAAAMGSADYCEERPEHISSEMMLKCFRTFAKVAGVPIAFIGMGRGQDWDLTVVRDYAWNSHIKRYGHAPIIAGVNARFLRDSSVKDIVELVKRYVDVMGRRGKFFVFLANIPADTPPDHVHAVLAAVRTYGHYPIAKNLDAIEFKMPQRETFQEYAKRQGLSSVIG